MRETISVCRSLAAASVRGQMQYRASFVLDVLSGIVFQGIGLIFIWALLERFNAIEGWTLVEIGLLYAIRLTAHGLFQVMFGGIMRLDALVVSGEFDRLMIRPIPPLVQLMINYLRISTLGDLFGGIALLLVVLSALDVDWTPAKVMLLVLAIVGGAMIDGGLQILPASMAFRFFESWPILRIVDDVFSTFGNYPMTIFDRITRSLLTFALPLAFVAYLPASALLERETFLPLWTAWLTPLIGLTIFSLAIITFTRETRQYQSSGN